MPLPGHCFKTFLIKFIKECHEWTSNFAYFVSKIGIFREKHFRSKGMLYFNVAREFSCCFILISIRKIENHLLNGLIYDYERSYQNLDKIRI